MVVLPASPGLLFAWLTSRYRKIGSRLRERRRLNAQRQSHAQHDHQWLHGSDSGVRPTLRVAVCSSLAFFLGLDSEVAGVDGRGSSWQSLDDDLADEVLFSQAFREVVALAFRLPVTTSPFWFDADVDVRVWI
jgi:hypothetical protein